MTTYSSNLIGPSVPPKYLEKGVISVVAQFTIATALVAGDIIQMIQVPQGAQILDVGLAVPQLDTNATPTISLNVGDGTTHNRYIAGDTNGELAAGGVTRLNQEGGLGYQYTTNGNTINVECGTAAATAKLGQTITLTCTYACDSYPYA